MLPRKEDGLAETNIRAILSGIRSTLKIFHPLCLRTIGIQFDQSACSEENKEAVMGGVWL